MTKILNQYQIAFENYLYSENCTRDLKIVIDKIKKHNKILVLGNGGSCTISTHFGEDVAKICGIPTLVFNDAALITCLSNDYSYQTAMQEWLKIYYNVNDLVILISSSGNSANILNAAKWVKPDDLITLTGFEKNNKLLSYGEAVKSLNVYVPIKHYGIVESIHATFLHMVLDTLIEERKEEQ